MKKILILMVMLLGFAFFNQVKAVEDGASNVVVKDEKMLGADFSNGVYAYELGKKFTKSPNTISAWVRMGNLGINEAGGTIFSNYSADNKQAIKLEVDSNRNVSLFWNGGQATATFSDYKVAYNEWTMLTVTRDSDHGLFKLYVNGKLEQTISMYAGSDSVCDYRFVIGGDWSCWSVNKYPFRGEISQVTVYEQTLKTKEVYEDYLYSDDISSSNRSGLMFNGYLSYRCSEVVDTSSNKNNATIRSNDLYYEGDIYAAQDYTFAVIPDPQIMTHWNQGNLPTLSKYLIDYNNKYKNKLAMALCVGDNADGVNSSFPQYDMDYQLSAMKAEYDKLYNAGIRWMTTPGNHDYDYNCTNTGDASTARSLAYYNKYFSEEELSTYDYWGDSYKSGQTQNAFYLFEVCGVSYLVISIEYGADDKVLEWANSVVSAYPECRTIVYTHAFMGSDGEILSPTKPHTPGGYGFAQIVQVNHSSQIFDKFVKKHENIFMVFSGHVPVDDIFRNEQVGDHGNIISCFLIDAQGVLGTAHDSIVSLLTFDELNQTVSINYVSTTLNKLYNIQNQFTYSFKGHTNILSSVYYNADGTLKDEYR